MNRKTELLAKRIEKAGIRASIKEGHILTESEIRNIKVQILPIPLRVLFGILGVVAAGASYVFFSNDMDGLGGFSAVLSVFMVLFGIFGMRRTLSVILDSMNTADGVELLAQAMEGIASAVGSLFEGL